MKAINLFSETFDPCASYGRMAHELTAHLTAQGYHVNCFAPGGEHLPTQQIVPSMGGILLAHPVRLPQIRATYPVQFAGKWVCCTGNEMTELPRGWRVNLNQMSAVSVWSNFLKDVFVQNGVTVPVQVDSLGISEAYTAQPALKRELKEGEPLTFLAIGDRGERKGSHLALFAFVQAFGNDERYKLIIKRRNGADLLSNPNVELITGDYTDEQMAELYHRAHVMIFPAAGEGFGLPPREFVATGGIALATDWSGLTDGIDAWGIRISDYTMGPAYQTANDDEWAVGQWANVDVDSLAHQLKRVATWFDYYAENAMQGAQYARKQYQWSTWAQSLQDLYESVNAQEAIA